MKVLIVGAGALGSVFGCLLRKMGHEVDLLEPGPRLQDIAERGLKLSGLFGEHECGDFGLYSSANELPERRHELVLVTVKSFDTSEAVRAIAKRISSDALVISLQNGLGNYEAISHAVGQHRALAGRVIFGAQMIEKAHVKVTVYAEPVMIGSPTNSVDFGRIQKIATEFDGAGVPTQATTEINKYIWAKMLYNCALNPLSAILDVPYGRLLETEFSRNLMREVVNEIFAVAQAHGIELFWNKPEDYVELLFGRLIPDTSAHYASMAQDLQAGRKTEIDALNGAIVRLGKQTRVECCANRILSELVRAAERLRAED